MHFEFTYYLAHFDLSFTYWTCCHILQPSINTAAVILMRTGKSLAHFPLLERTKAHRAVVAWIVFYHVFWQLLDSSGISALRCIDDEI